MRLFRAPWPEVGRRAARPAARRLGHDAWPTSASASSSLGAAFETAWRAEAAEALRPRPDHARSAAISLTPRPGRRTEFGPNYDGRARLDPRHRRDGRAALRGRAGAARSTPPAARPSPGSPSARSGSTTSTWCSGEQRAGAERRAGLAGPRLLEPLGAADLRRAAAHGAGRRCLAVRPPPAVRGRRAERARGAGRRRRPNDAEDGCGAPPAPLSRCSCCGAAAADPADRLADPAQEARARALFRDDALPGLPERVDRRVRRAAGPRPAPDGPPAGGGRAHRRPDPAPFWSAATASSCC